MNPSLRHQLPVVGGGGALVELEATDVEAGDLVVVVGELLVVGDVGDVVDDGDREGERPVGRQLRQAVGHVAAGDGEPLPDDLLVPRVVISSCETFYNYITSQISSMPILLRPIIFSQSVN